jgi:hypothetical protein
MNFANAQEHVPEAECNNRVVKERVRTTYPTGDVRPTKKQLSDRRCTADQEAIGWDYAFQGYLSTKWARAQNVEHPHSTALGIRQQWLKAVIRAMQDVNSALWDERIVGRAQPHSTSNSGKQKNT